MLATIIIFFFVILVIKAMMNGDNLSMLDSDLGSSLLKVLIGIILCVLVVTVILALF